MQNIANSKGFRVDLRRRRLSGGSVPPSLYGGDIDEVVFEVNYHNDYSLGFTVQLINDSVLNLQFYSKGSDPESARPPVPITPQSQIINGNQLYKVELVSSEKGQPFNFQIRRKSSNAIM